MVSVDNIKDFTVRDFWNYGIVVSDFNNFPDYYIEYLKSRGSCALYTQYQEYLQAVKLNFMKYIEVSVGSDVVLIFYKCVYMANRIKVHDMPVSKSKSIEDEAEVSKVLLRLDFVTSITVDETRIRLYDFISYGTKDRCYMLDNFFYSYSFCESVFKGRYNRKFGIDSLRENLRVDIYRGGLDDNGRDISVSIYESWAEYSKSKATKKFLDAVNYYSDNTYFRIYYYKDEPVGVTMLLDYEGYVISNFKYTKARMLSNTDMKRVVKRLDFYIGYMDIKYFSDIYRKDMKLYILGSGEKSQNDSLYLYKLRNSEGFIKYYEIKRGNLI